MMECACDGALSHADTEDEVQRVAAQREVVGVEQPLLGLYLELWVGRQIPLRPGSTPVLLAQNAQQSAADHADSVRIARFRRFAA